MQRSGAFCFSISHAPGPTRAMLPSSSLRSCPALPCVVSLLAPPAAAGAQHSPRECNRKRDSESGG
eukprot:2747787-Rhodomonas_salina.3